MTYRDQRNGLDLHIICFDTSYEDEYHMVTCRVTYPGISGQPPVTIDYNPTNDSDLSFDVVRARMMEDIDSFIQAPEGWMRTYVGQSVDIHRALVDAQVHLEEYMQRLEDHRENIAAYEKLVAEYQQTVARLQGEERT